MSKELSLKVAIWIIPVLFGAGALYQTVIGSSAAVAEIQVQLESHEDLAAHPVTELRVTQSEDQIEEILVEQRAMRAEQSDQAESISAICQATGARCR